MSVYPFPVDNMVEPDSSFVEEVGFTAIDDDNTGYLYIRLNGKYYVYDDVSESEFTRLAHADSVGHAYREFASGRKSVGTYPASEYQMVWDSRVKEEPTIEDVLEFDVSDFDGAPEEGVKNDIEWEDEPEEVSVEQYLWIRTEALHRAVELSGYNSDGDTALALARKFEDYIFNG